MKLYQTTSSFEDAESGDVSKFTEFTSSASDASKARTRLKKFGHEKIDTKDIEVGTDRTSIITMLNTLVAHPSWVVEPVAKAVVG